MGKHIKVVCLEGDNFFMQAHLFEDILRGLLLFYKTFLCECLGSVEARHEAKRMKDTRLRWARLHSSGN